MKVKWENIKGFLTKKKGLPVFRLFLRVEPETESSTSIFALVSKEEVEEKFYHLKEGERLVIVNEAFKPVLYMTAYIYESSYEYFELGKSMVLFDGTKRRYLCQDGWIGGNGCKEDIEMEIEKLTGTLYAVDEKDYECFVNEYSIIQWEIGGVNVGAGERAVLERYRRAGDDADYPELSGVGTVTFHIKKEYPCFVFYKEIWKYSVMRDGEIISEVYGNSSSIALNDACIIRVAGGVRRIPRH